MKLHFLGADDGVTGSRHLVDSAGSRILLDCALFQGWRAHRERNWLAPEALRPEALRTLDAVVLSHAHLDRSGWLPVWVRHGYRGPVHASPATCALLKVPLLDSAHLQEEDTRRANGYGYSRHENALPLYTRADAQRALSLLVPLAPGRAVGIARHTVTLTPVGHLLGACAVTLQESGRAGRRLVFSGDLGRRHDLLMPPPEPVPRADVLLVDSTCGNQLEGFSGHADRGELLDWLRQVRQPPAQTFVVHGEPDASDTLRAEIQTRPGWRVRVPAYGETVEL